MKKYFVLFVSLMLSAPFAGAQQKISKAYAECTSQDDQLSDKLKAYKNFKYVDNDKFNSTFLKANLIYSEIQPTYSYESKTGVFFAIQPMWIVDVIPTTLFPRFVARCENKTSPLSLSCTHFAAKNPILEFAVDDFSLNLSVVPSKSCSSGSQVNISYYIVINNNAYDKLRQELISYGIPESETNAETFLNDYWTEFLTAWKDNSDWLSN